MGSRPRWIPAPCSTAPRVTAVVWTLALFAGTAGCGLIFPETPPSPSPVDDVLESEPYPADAADPASVEQGVTGTLRQDEISVTLRRGELQIRVTPLHESVIRVAAPDTYERLSAMARGHQRIFQERTGAAVPFQLFLVSLYTEAVEVSFEPEGLNLVNRGLRYRPVDVQPLTSDWNTRRVRPRQVLMAVYGFPELDLERSLEVEYLEVRSREWDQVLPVIQSERSRLGIATSPP